MFGWFEKPKFVPVPVETEPENIVATCDPIEFTGDCCPKTGWYTKYPDALHPGESLADAVERLYNSGREDRTEHCCECGHDYDEEPWEYVPFWSEDAEIDEDGDYGPSIQDNAGWDTHNWACPIPYKLFLSMRKVAKDDLAAARIRPAPGESLAAIDWDWYLADPPKVKMAEPTGPTVVDRSDLPAFDAFSRPDLVGEIVRRGAVGRSGAFAPFSSQDDNAIREAVKEAREISGDRKLSEIAEGVWNEDVKTHDPLPPRRRGLIFRTRTRLGILFAELAVKVLPREKLDQILNREE